MKEERKKAPQKLILFYLFSFKCFLLLNILVGTKTFSITEIKNWQRCAEKFEGPKSALFFPDGSNNKNQSQNKDEK